MHHIAEVERCEPLEPRERREISKVHATPRATPFTIIPGAPAEREGRNLLGEPAGREVLDAVAVLELQALVPRRRYAVPIGSILIHTFIHRLGYLIRVLVSYLLRA